MALETYRKKRQFAVTAEPRGRKGPRGGYRYVIQKHAARRLHYDLRLELDGVMKSWAVTRGPSLDPNEKRLAIHVEDHPIEYNAFEGTIPQGQYGGGAVMIWDRGSWAPEGDPHRGYAKGHLVFDLHGEKLRGRWHLVRMRKRAGESHDNWLLIKAKDEEARTPHAEDILEEQPDSVTTGRSIAEIAAGKGGKKRVWHSKRVADAAASEPDRSEIARSGTMVTFRDKIRKLAAAPPAKRQAKTTSNARSAGRRPRARTSARITALGAAKSRLPEFVPFSLAAFYDRAPGGPQWLHEIKFDGYRMQARLLHGKVRLLTRKEQDWTHRFTPVAAAVAALPAEATLLDGEIVVEDDHGISNFSLLQSNLKEGRADRFVYYVFDLLHLDGRDLTKEPLITRKAALKRLVEGAVRGGVIRYTEHFDEEGPLILRHACEMGLEGIVSKRRDAPYRSGRSDNFVKAKCHDRQEFVVAGYTLSAVVPQSIGALIVAVHEDGGLRYAGRIGTGYTQQTARDLWRRLDPLRTDRRPVGLPADEHRKDIVWVAPKLVVEAEFAGITHGGVLRQASFKGLREDKTAREVVREVPATPRTAPAPAKARVDNGGNGGPSKQARSSGVALRLTHPDRVYWPDVGITKADLAAYYVSVWEWISPHIVGRALSLLRSPEGVGGETFFQKHIAANVRSSPVRRTVGGKDGDVIAVETLDDLIMLVQSGALEIHVRGSRLQSLETCDRIVFDLDPGENVAWPQIVAAARETRERLRAEKLESFVKLSGGKGVHVVVPIAGADWDTTKLFARRIAAAMAADSPRLYLAKMTKSLRQGRIFIDYFRNSREATSVAAYSTRARPGAPVSAPVTWERLARAAGGDDFSVLDLKKRIKDDAWAEIDTLRQKLPNMSGERR